MSIASAWGRYPKIQCQRFDYTQETQLQEILSQNNSIIAFGNGRSYGDSALSEWIVDNKQRHFFIDFNEHTGLLHTQAGVLLADVIEYFVPRGWFLKITPGTKLITLGGAIASDVHGKNHHVEGCFSECIKEFTMMLADGNVVLCSKDNSPELFKATCGGQGLTGVILEVKIYLKKINSQFIDQTTIKTHSLKDTFELFDTYQNQPYSVAWIDCLSTGNKLGRSLLMVGNFMSDGNINYQRPSAKTIPFDFPTFALSSWSVKIFNTLYYAKIRSPISKQVVSIDAFFYPLDKLNHWNRIYGKHGFIQYQVILPKENSYEGLQKILSKIAVSGKGSFLAVLKLHGKANGNWLSFPMEGYSLALDFKIEKGLFALLDSLDTIVLRYGGRHYLAKDGRVSKEVFEQGYPQIDQFRAYRKIHHMDRKFQSLQSKRLQI